MEFRLPELGEGIETATVVGVLVKPGDAVSAGQSVLAVETDKAAVDVPVDVAGTVNEIKVKPGDKVPIGGVILTFSGNGKPAEKAKEKPAEPPAAAASEKPKPAPAAPPTQSQSVTFKLPELGEGIETATVVGVLVKNGDTVTANQNVLAMETDKAAFEVPIDVAGTITEIKVKPNDKLRVGADILVLQTAEGAKTPEAATNSKPKTEPVTHAAPTKTAPAKTVAPATQDFTAAGPATRRLARELGVALTEIKGTGREGRVTLDDVKTFVRTERKQGPAGGSASVGHPPLPDFAKFGEVELKPVSGIRKKIAENLTLALRTIPAVTQNDLADITELESGRKRVVEGLPKSEAKITWTVLAVKACVAALKEFPHFNASFDMNAGTLILKKYFHIGIAVDTERGLVVPVIRNADSKSVRDIAAEVAALAEKARAGKLSLEEMRGGSFTITNLGGIGGTSFTPIVNYPEVAILGMSRSVWQPVVRENQIVPRLMLPLSLTYDHRVIDGADGARFITRLTQLFSDPMRLLMES